MTENASNVRPTGEDIQGLLQAARLLVKAYDVDVAGGESVDWAALDAAMQVLENIQGEMPNLVKSLLKKALKLPDKSVLDEMVHEGCSKAAADDLNKRGLSPDEDEAEEVQDIYSEKASAINHEGMEAQIKAILQHGWATPQELGNLMDGALQRKNQTR